MARHTPGIPSTGGGTVQGRTYKQGGLSSSLGPYTATRPNSHLLIVHAMSIYRVPDIHRPLLEACGQRTRLHAEPRGRNCAGSISSNIITKKRKDNQITNHIVTL